jgi:hypothetical protein
VLTPVHVFTLERQDGTRRRVAIPGSYCTRRRPTLRHGERIVPGTQTWRSDLRYLDHPSGQRDYQTGLYGDGWRP